MDSATGIHYLNALLPAPHKDAVVGEGANLLASIMSEFGALEATFAKDGVVDFGRLRRQLKKLVRGWA